MAVTPSDVGLGMDVRGSKGEKVGTVEEVAATGAGVAYMLVDKGGILGIGGERLWIPLSAVARVESGRHVVLQCTKDEASARYQKNPGFPAV